MDNTSNSQNSDQIITYEEILFLINRNKKIIAFCLIFCFIIGLGFGLLTLPRYTAVGKIYIEDVSSKNNALFDLATGRDRNMIRNQIEIIKSKKIAELTVDSISKQKEKDSLYLFKTRNENLDYDNHVTPALRKLFFLERFHYKTFKEAVEVEGESIKNNAASYIQSNLGIENSRNTEILVLRYTSNNAKESSFILNQLIDTYKNQDVKWENDENSYLQDFLNSQLAIKNNELSIIEDELREFQEKNKIFALDENSSILLQELQVAESEFYSSETEINILQEREKYYKNKLSDDEKEFSQSLINTIDLQLYALRSELGQLEAEYASSKSKKDTNLMALQSIELKINNLKSSINKETNKLVNSGIYASNPIQYRQSLIDSLITINSSKNMLLAKKSELQKVVKLYNDKLEKLPAQYLQFSKLQRDKIILDETYGLMKRKFEESRIAEASKLGKITVIDYATSNVQKSWPPGIILIIAMSLFSSIILSGIIILIKELLDSAIKNIDYVENKNISVLALIPQIDLTNKEMLDNRRLIVTKDSRSPIAESYRSLRTALSFNFSDEKFKNKCKTILISSSGPKEGKSTTCSNLAATYALLGKKTLLIDFDMRKPVIAKSFELNTNKGMSNIYVNDDAIANNIQKTEVENLDILGCGPIPPNPAEMLSSEKLKKILENLKERYDYIIADTPPMIAVTDTTILRPLFDQFLLVIRAGNTQKAALERVIKIAKYAGFEINNAVLNEVSSQTSYGGGYYYSYYQYYYGDETDKKLGKKRKGNK